MRKISLSLIVSALFAISASAQTLVTEGAYSGGEDELLSQVSVDSEGILNLLQSCYGGYTTEAVTVDQYGNFSAEGQFGTREFIGTGIVDPVDVHFVGAEDTVAETLDIFVIEDSTFNVLTHVVVVLGDLESLPHCGQNPGVASAKSTGSRAKVPTRATALRGASARRARR